jgi:hypothetical protein
MGYELLFGSIAALSSLASAGTGIASATQKPDTPKIPQTGLSPGALSSMRRQRAGAQGRMSTNITGSKLGQVGS